MMQRSVLLLRPLSFVTGKTSLYEQLTNFDCRRYWNQFGPGAILKRSKLRWPCQWMTAVGKSAVPQILSKVLPLSTELENKKSNEIRYNIKEYFSAQVATRPSKFYEYWHENPANNLLFFGWLIKLLLKRVERLKKSDCCINVINLLIFLPCPVRQIPH